jgi:peroxiredoxin Q/BCP
MTFLDEKTRAPTFTLKDENGKQHTLSSYKGQWVVLYFYPKDDTPGCTIEGIEFTAKAKEFKKLNTKVFGISGDNQESHKAFCKKHKLGITLLSDPGYKMMTKYGSHGPKILYGRTFLGVKRSTYIIDPQGKVAKVWKAVQAKNHAAKVLESIMLLSSARSN